MPKRPSRGPRRKTSLKGEKKISKNRLRRAIAASRRGEPLRGRSRAFVEEIGAHESARARRGAKAA